MQLWANEGVYPFRKMLLRSIQPTLRTSKTSERYHLTCTGRAGRHDDPRRNGSYLVILEFVQHAKDSRLLEPGVEGRLGSRCIRKISGVFRSNPIQSNRPL